MAWQKANPRLDKCPVCGADLTIRPEMLRSRGYGANWRNGTRWPNDNDKTGIVMSEPNWDDWRVQCEGDDPLRYALPIGYDGEIVEDVFNVMLLLRTDRLAFYDHIAAKLSLEPKYVHLILEVLADKDMTEYGTSPRGSWLTDEGEALLAAGERYRTRSIER